MIYWSVLPDNYDASHHHYTYDDAGPYDNINVYHATNHRINDENIAEAD